MKNRNLKTVVIFRSGCRLTWGACKDDGGLPVEYVVEKFVAAADAWSKAGQVSGTAFEVNDLEVGREYAFAVRAVNSEGESDALPTPKTIVAKDAYSKCTSHILFVEYIQ